MSKKSYNIKHDYLFDIEDTIVTIPLKNNTLKDASILYLSKIMDAYNESKFYCLIQDLKEDIILIDNIGKCVNIQSEKYKQFIIRCTYRKLLSLNHNVYM